jgi:hypothetical protein
MESLHGFFDRSFIVESVDLEEVDVSGLQAGEGSVNGVEDCLAG